MRLWFATVVLAISLTVLFVLFMREGGLLYAVFGVCAVVGVTLLMNVLFIALE